MKREIHNLNQSLDAIWRRGDRDEMSIKHIGPGLAALVAFGDWRKGEDYEYPIYYGAEGWSDLQVKNAYRNLDDLLDQKWGRIAQYLDDWGKDKFLEVLEQSKFSFHALWYLDNDYYSQAVA